MALPEPEEREYHEECKIVAVGEKDVGKTSLLMTYIEKSFPSEYVPTVIGDYTSQETSDDLAFMLTLYDTAGHRDYARIRMLLYPKTDVFLLCFDVNTPLSFERIRDFWVPEVRAFFSQTSASHSFEMLLVGTKTDLRGPKPNPHDHISTNEVETKESRCCIAITEEMGKALAREIGAFDYVECSAKLRLGVEAVIQTAIAKFVSSKVRSPLNISLGPQPIRSHICMFL